MLHSFPEFMVSEENLDIILIFLSVGSKVLFLWLLSWCLPLSLIFSPYFFRYYMNLSFIPPTFSHSLSPFFLLSPPCSSPNIHITHFVIVYSNCIFWPHFFFFPLVLEISVERSSSSEVISGVMSRLLWSPSKAFCISITMDFLSW